MLARANLLTVLPGLPRKALSGPWYRAVLFDYLQGPPPGAVPGSPVQPLWPGGAQQKGVRFTPKAPPSAGINALYLATEEKTALEEVTGILRPKGSPVALVFPPLALLTVRGVLTNVVDVSDAAVEKALGTNHQELTGDWEVMQVDYLAGKGPLPPTQVLGEAAFAAGGIVGLLYKSAKSSAKADAIVVFTDRLAAAGCYVELFNDPAGKLQQRIP